ncbi:MAG: hypothetical protein U0792_09770 [Gemmataceae bacterium]
MQLLAEGAARGYIIRYASKLSRLTRPLHGQDGEPPTPACPTYRRSTSKRWSTCGVNPDPRCEGIVLKHGRAYVARG